MHTPDDDLTDDHMRLLAWLSAHPTGSLAAAATLFVRPNEAGGRTHYSDEIGGETMVWDTCLVDEPTLLAAIVEAYRTQWRNDSRKPYSPPARSRGL